MTAPPVGVMCADCKAAPAAVQAGNEWVCWVCDEKASQAAESGSFEIALVPADGEDMRPEYRYDGAWATLKAGVGREDVVMTFPSRVDAKRATFALVKRAQAAGLKLRSKRIARMPIKVRYRLVGDVKIGEAKRELQ
jgi:hypothetical protein